MISTETVDVVGTGFTVLDRIYADLRAVASEELGGSCGNVLLSLAMLDRCVAPVLNLGLDDVGNRLVGEFKGAGAETRFIRRRSDRRSPVLAQHLDTVSGSHFFAFTCPETNEELPRYEPIEWEDVEHARPMLMNCAIFYTDRLSDAIVEAMETAAGAGAIVYFEPSEVQRADLFRRAVAVTTVLKFSADRLDGFMDEGVPGTAISIVTYGEAGLELRMGSNRHWCHSYPASEVRDTCGSGDMVSVGLIDWLLAHRPSRQSDLNLDMLVPGIEAGQRLAAENCAYVGARGLFRQRGAAYARSVLSGEAE
ncbi:MAG: hypothetical protein H2054_09025 [Sphingomonas sp.]|nr:hypothetical protein [Sphingomonas sp.]